MFEFSDLRAFARIADLGSISGAARSLRMPKSSVSRSLVRLEKAIGAVLVERSTRHLRLTDAGLLLKRHAARILDDVSEAENAIIGLTGVPRGDLRVSVPFTFAAGPLASMLPGFIEHYSEVRVVLDIDNRQIDLLADETDVAIRIGPLPDSELISRRLTSFALWPCASPTYLAGTPPIGSPTDLLAHQLIAHADRRERWEFGATAGVVNTIEFVPGAVVPEPDVLRTMLLAHVGIGLLPDFHAAQDVLAGRLIRVLSDLNCGSVEAHALYPSHRSLSAKVRVFIDALVVHLEGDP